MKGYHSLKTKEQRNRMRKVVMTAAMLILALGFFLCVSWTGAKEPLGEQELDPRKLQAEDWKMQINTEYVNRVMDIYTTISKVQPTESMLTKEECRQSLNSEDVSFAYYVNECPEFETYKEEMEKSGDDCWWKMDQDPQEFTYVTDGHLLLIYCKQHQYLSAVMPYRLSESDLVRELEADGLEGLSEWMKQVESSGMPDQKLFRGICVVYDEYGLSFECSHSFAYHYKYLDDMVDSVEEAGWHVNDVMFSGYEKGVRCSLEMKENSLTGIAETDAAGAEIIADQDKVKQLCVKIVHEHSKAGEALIDGYEKEVQDLLVYAGLDREKAGELVKGLVCGSDPQSGVTGGYTWSMKRISEYVEEDADTGEKVMQEQYLLILTKAE